MDDYDRERSGRTNDPYGRSRSSEDVNRASGRRVPPATGEVNLDDPYVEPERVARRRSRLDDDFLTDPNNRPDDRSTESGSSGAPQRYSDRFRRSRSPEANDSFVGEPSRSSTRDPYDRLRTTTSRPPRRVEFDPRDDSDLSYLDEDSDIRSPSTSRSRRPSTRRTVPKADAQRFRAVGASLANPAPEVRPLAIGGIAAFASLILLCILVLVRSSSLPAWIPMHLDAEGVANEFGTSATIWRLPFFAFMSTVAALGLGWWLRTREAYATQYLIVGSLLIHGLVWVGTVNLLW